MKNIFTLIEYTSSNIDRCGDYTGSDLSISNWTDSDYDEVVKVIADILYRQSIKAYGYDDFTLLINGIAVNYTDTYCINTSINIPLTEEERLHDEYVETFWAKAISLKEEAKKAYDTAQAEKREREKKAQEERERIEKEKKEAAERAQLQTLLAKYGN